MSENIAAWTTTYRYVYGSIFSSCFINEICVDLIFLLHSKLIISVLIHMNAKNINEVSAGQSVVYWKQIQLQYNNKILMCHLLDLLNICSTVLLFYNSHFSEFRLPSLKDYAVV